MILKAQGTQTEKRYELLSTISQPKPRPHARVVHD